VQPLAGRFDGAIRILEEQVQQQNDMDRSRWVLGLAGYVSCTEGGLAGSGLTFDDRRLRAPLFGSQNVATKKGMTDTALTVEKARVGERRRRTVRVLPASDPPGSNQTSGTAGLVGPGSNNREVNTSLLTERGEGISFTKDSRGERTPIELFIAGVRRWEAGLRRRIDGENPVPE
jgi:hypothetical protein